MPKLNISGLASKCKELWKNVLEINAIIIEGLALEEEVSKNKSEDKPSTEEFSVVKKPKDCDSLSSNPYDSKDRIKDNDNHNDNHSDNDDVKEERFAMDALKELFSDYIGVSIVGFVSYKESTKDLEARIGPHRGVINIVTDIDIEKNNLWLKLTNYDGKHNGYLKITPSITAQVSEKNSADEEDKMARYRIKFMGEDSIEYSDKDDGGQIIYFEGKRQ